MDVTTKQWLTILVIVVIVGIFLDGFRRMRKARRDSLTMSLDPKKTTSIEDSRYGSEFPNGGARSSEKEIDADRIAKARSQYDFGSDMTSLKEDRLRSQGKDEHYEDEQDGAPLHEVEEYSHDQWVDSDEGDEDYYGKKWDDEYDETEEEIEEQIEEQLAPSIELEEDEGTELDSIESVNIDKNTNQESISSGREHERLQPLDDEDVDDVFADDVNVLEDQPAKQAVVQPVEPKVYTEPEQTSLNLEDTVPVLMETTETPNKEHIEPQVPDSDDVLLEDEDSNVEIRSVGTRIRKNIEPTVGDEAELDTRSVNKPRYESKYFSNAAKAPEQNDENHLEEVLILHIRATGEEPFECADLLHAALQQGMRYGAMDIFHFHTDEDGEGPVLFSMANMLMPGIFDLKTIEQFTTIGVTFFMTMPVVDNNNMAAFDTMLATAKEIAAELGGELKDEQRSVMMAQTVEHYRERIRDFARKQKLQKNK